MFSKHAFPLPLMIVSSQIPMICFAQSPTNIQMIFDALYISAVCFLVEMSRGRGSMKSKALSFKKNQAENVTDM